MSAERDPLQLLVDLPPNLREKTAEAQAALTVVVANLLGTNPFPDAAALHCRALDILTARRHPRPKTAVDTAWQPLFAEQSKRARAKIAAEVSAVAQDPDTVCLNDSSTLTERTEKAVAILARKSRETIYRQGFFLSRLRSDDDKAGRQLQLLVPDSLLGEMDRVIRFVKVGELGEMRVDPPMKLVDGLFTWPDYSGFRRMERLTSTPFVSPSGRVVSKVGYDEETGMYLAATLAFDPVPDVPTVEDVRDAVAWLHKPFCDFPFDSEHGRAGIAHTFAALVGPVARPIYTGPTPVFPVDASAERAGKGLLVELVGYILTGKKVEVRMYPTEENEIRKKILSELSTGPTIVFLDNISRQVDSAALAAAVTAEVIRERILGKTEDRVVPNLSQWMLSGNNLALSREMLFRSAPIRIVPLVENPGLRTGPTEGTTWTYKQPEWTIANRAELFRSVLILVRNWIAQGRPLFKERTLGRFEGWCEVVGGILQAAGVEGFLENLPELVADAEWERGGWPSLIDEWWGLWKGVVIPGESQELEKLAIAAGVIPNLPDDAERRKELGLALRSKRGLVRQVGDGVSVRLSRYDEKTSKSWVGPRPGVKRGWYLAVENPAGNGRREETGAERVTFPHSTHKPHTKPPLEAIPVCVPPHIEHVDLIHILKPSDRKERDAQEKPLGVGSHVGYVGDVDGGGNIVTQEGASERAEAPRGRPGQPRKWASAAEKQRAYRDRSRSNGGGPEVTGGPLKPLAAGWSAGDAPPGTITDPEEIARLFNDPIDHTAVDRALAADAAYRLARRRGSRRPR